VEQITEEDLLISSCFPKLTNIRTFSRHVATRVVQKAVEEGEATDPTCIALAE